MSSPFRLLRDPFHTTEVRGCRVNYPGQNTSPLGAFKPVISFAQFAFVCMCPSENNPDIPASVTKLQHSHLHRQLEDFLIFGLFNISSLLHNSHYNGNKMTIKAGWSKFTAISALSLLCVMIDVYRYFPGETENISLLYLFISARISKCIQSNKSYFHPLLGCMSWVLSRLDINLLHKLQ